MQELRYASRRLRRQAGATIASIVTLAVAISAATTAWVIVSATVLQPIPGASTDRWFVVHEIRDDGATTFGFNYPARA